MVDNNIRTDISVLYRWTGAIITQEKRILINEKNMKSLAMTPPKKDLIPNQYVNILGKKKIKLFHHN